MNNMIFFVQKKQSGFTLVETLVGITVLLVAIVGPMTMAARGLQSAFHARDQITAVYLAQEAIELVRAYRDGNVLRNTQGWLDGIVYPSSPCDRNNTDGCGISVNAPRDIRNCRSSVDTCVIRDAGSGRFYVHGGTGQPTPFTRKIWVEQFANGREAEITVEVSWQSGLFANIRTVRLQSRIFNHYDFLE